jgi:hypothetical protein
MCISWSYYLGAKYINETEIHSVAQQNDIQPTTIIGLHGLYPGASCVDSNSSCSCSFCDFFPDPLAARVVAAPLVPLVPTLVPPLPPVALPNV